MENGIRSIRSRRCILVKKRRKKRCIDRCIKVHASRIQDWEKLFLKYSSCDDTCSLSVVSNDGWNEFEELLVCKSIVENQNDPSPISVTGDHCEEQNLYKDNEIKSPATSSSVLEPCLNKITLNVKQSEVTSITEERIDEFASQGSKYVSSSDRVNSLLNETSGFGSCDNINSARGVAYDKPVQQTFSNCLEHQVSCNNLNADSGIDTRGLQYTVDNTSTLGTMPCITDHSNVKLTLPELVKKNDTGNKNIDVIVNEVLECNRHVELSKENTENAVISAVGESNVNTSLCGSNLTYNDKLDFRTQSLSKFNNKNICDLKRDSVGKQKNKRYEIFTCTNYNLDEFVKNPGSVWLPLSCEMLKKSRVNKKIDIECLLGKM